MDERHVGRPLVFKTPEELWDIYCEYKEWSKNNPLYKMHPLKDGTIVPLPIDRPLTIWGFATFCGLSRQGLANYGEREDHSQFFGIYSRICNEMTSQRIEYGLTDMYNARLVARIDGIVEKRELDAKVTQKEELDLSKLKPDQVKQLSDAMSALGNDL